MFVNMIVNCEETTTVVYILHGAVSALCAVKKPSIAQSWYCKYTRSTSCSAAPSDGVRYSGHNILPFLFPDIM